MSISRCRTRLAGQVVPVVLVFQGMAVLAIPVALCCCLTMVAGATDESAVPGGDDACVHHDPAPPATGDAAGSADGCRHVDSFVVALAGLIGIAAPVQDVVPTFVPLSVVSAPTVRAENAVLTIDSPPPQL